MDRVRVGVVGTSWFTEALHLPALQSHPRAQVVALCGRNEERLTAVASAFGVPQRFTDWKRMIATAPLDALVVASPDDLHHPMAMQAMEAGLHVLCEKPLAMSVPQAREMMETARSKRLVTLSNFTYRWLPVYRYVGRLIQEGYLGRLLRIEARYLGGYLRGRDPTWRADPQRSLGALGDLGSHMIDLVLQFAGPITGVSASLASFMPKDDAQGKPVEPRANDSAFCLARLESGAQGLVEVTSVAHVADRFQEQHLVLHGEDGTLEADLVMTQGMRLRGARASESVFQDLPIPADLLAGVDPSRTIFETIGPYFQSQPIGARAFVDAILSGSAACPSFDDGYRVQQVIGAALASHAGGTWAAVE